MLLSESTLLESKPDFNLASLVSLRVLLKTVSCFEKKSEEVPALFIKKYSSWYVEL
jgi:hypothetical protein